MDRREFAKNLGMGAIALGFGGQRLSGALPEKKDGPEIAITIDDFNWNKSVRLEPNERNRAILGALKLHGDLKAALFVAGKHADNETGKSLLGEWHTIPEALSFPISQGRRNSGKAGRNQSFSKATWLSHRPCNDRRV